MKLTLSVAAVALACALLMPRPASACGGFFCSASPVDQNAERIVFAVDEASDTTEMIVQIAYQGDDAAFAWLLPVGSVPQNRDVFPNGALAPLDAQTGPTFQPPPGCWASKNAARGPSGAGAVQNDSADGVTVHVQETVGPFHTVVIESADSALTFKWLVDNGYRLSPVMKPYIDLYTAQGMMFLALRLASTATAKDIQPFRMTLPGITPTIPLRLTAVAAEPEMSVVVWIFGQRRYEPANAKEIEIPKHELRWDPRGWPIRTNWSELVARKVDEEGGRGWVVEQAGSTSELESALQNTGTATPEQLKARDALLGVVQGRPYMTRLYTRVAAEEMSYDPTFRRSDKGDVARARELPDDAPFCSPLSGMPTVDQCEFAACGQLGICGEVVDKATSTRVAGCACAPGSTARTTFDPQGRPIVTCQDQRMSFMNPGERDESGTVFADPCVGFSCGEHGRCVAMNLTPTCECEQGYVAVGTLSATGARQTACVLPTKAVPKNFYNRRPPQLAQGMIAGRAVDLPPAPTAADVAMPGTYGEPRPAAGAGPGAPKSKHGGCSVGLSEGSSASRAWLALLGLSWLLQRRRHR